MVRLIQPLPRPTVVSWLATWLRSPSVRHGLPVIQGDADRDLEAFVKEVVLPDCPPPVFALAHSMGASILLRSAFAGHRWFDRMVLLAPMIALPGMRRSLTTRTLVRTMRYVGLGGAYVPGGDATVSSTPDNAAADTSPSPRPQR